MLNFSNFNFFPTTILIQKCLCSLCTDFVDFFSLSYLKRIIITAVQLNLRADVLT